MHVTTLPKEHESSLVRKQEKYGLRPLFGPFALLFQICVKNTPVKQYFNFLLTILVFSNIWLYIISGHSFLVIIFLISVCLSSYS